MEQDEEDLFKYDSGWTAWSQVLVAHLLVINGFGYFSSFSLFESHWKETFQRSDADIAWVGSVQLFLLFFAGTTSGRAVAAGYFNYLLYSGCLLQLVGVFATSSIQSYWQLMLAQGVVQGFGNGFLFTPLVTLVSLYFKKYRAIALGLAACGAPLGGVIFAVISQQLAGVVTFPWIIRAMGFVILFNTILVVLLARPRHFKKVSGPFVAWTAFTERRYTLFVCGIFFVLWGVYVAYFYITTFSEHVLHIPASKSLTNLILLNAAGVAGRLIPAIIADQYFGAFNVLIPFTFVSGVTLLAWIAVVNRLDYIVFAIIYGICANAVQTLFPTTLASLTTNLSKMGVRTGMAFSIGSLACLTGAPIAGALISFHRGSYCYMQVFSGCSVLIGCALLVVARFSRASESSGDVAV